MTGRPVPSWLVALAVRVYALILRMYPRAFRERCADPMLETFETVCAGHVGRRALRPFLRDCAGECLNAAAGAWGVRRITGPRAPAISPASWVSSLWQDARYAVRRLVIQPSLVFFIVVTLGFAIAANAALFSIVDAVMLRPSPFAEADRLMNVINRTARGITFPGLSARKLKHWRTEHDIFESVEAYRPMSAVVTGGAEPEQLAAAQVSPGFLTTLAVPPSAGRLARRALRVPARRERERQP
jgi:putative ABC transport system permease protein